MADFKFTPKEFKGKGKVMFAKVFEDNMETMSWNDETGAFDKPDPKGGSYTVSILHEADDYMDLRKTGCMMCKYSKITDDGLESVKFRRWDEPKDASGKVKSWMAGPPKVTKADGSAWDFEEDGPIWNGADAEYVITVIDYPRVKGVTTLESLKILKNGTPPPEPEDVDTTEEVAF